MTIQPISAASVVLFLTPDDLHDYGICPHALTAARALELAREALEQVGLALEGSLEIETYPDKCGLLLFVRRAPTPQTVWRFEDWESLLAAVSALGAVQPDGSLYWWDGHCWLVLSGQQAGVGAQLSEFGSEETADPYILARLAEYGTPLLAANAPAALRHYFG